MLCTCRTWLTLIAEKAPKTCHQCFCTFLLSTSYSVTRQFCFILSFFFPWPNSWTMDAQWSLCFHRNPKPLGLGRYILGHLGYFRPNYQHPFWYKRVPCPWFPLFNHYFYKKLSLGFEFGPQRIRDLAFMCP